MAYKEVIRELVVREAVTAAGVPALIADLSVIDEWQLQTEVLFDICVIDTEAQSHVRRTVAAVLSSAER